MGSHPLAVVLLFIVGTALVMFPLGFAAGRQARVIDRIDDQDAARSEGVEAARRVVMTDITRRLDGQPPVVVAALADQAAHLREALVEIGGTAR